MQNRQEESGFSGPCFLTWNKVHAGKNCSSSIMLNARMPPPVVVPSCSPGLSILDLYNPLQPRCCFPFVGMLAYLFGALNDEISRLADRPHSRFCFVDVLTALAATMMRLEDDLIGLELLYFHCSPKAEVQETVLAFALRPERTPADPLH